MPTYQYACTSCDHTFEQFQSFTDDALTVCPQCQGRLRKVFNAVGVVFKGSGFYRTDSRSDATVSAGAAKSSGTADGASASNGSSGKTSTPDTSTASSAKTTSSTSSTSAA